SARVRRSGQCRSPQRRRGRRGRGRGSAPSGWGKGRTAPSQRSSSARAARRPTSTAPSSSGAARGTVVYRPRASCPARLSLGLGVEDDSLGSVSGEMAERLTERLARPTVDPERVAHVVVGQPALLEEALRRHDVAQPFPGVGLPRKLRDLDEALLGQALEVEVCQAQRDPETLRQHTLGEGVPFADGGEDLEVSLLVAFHDPPRLVAAFYL